MLLIAARATKVVLATDRTLCVACVSTYACHVSPTWCLQVPHIEHVLPMIPGGGSYKDTITKGDGS